ncbi:Flp pilus assembly protein CpaB [Nitrospira sp. BLG_1]|uniref:Flp pilus assembly protein CpaB n=1 Tax=Nitrospira sp. BLG_1 TaxID=3395883 RepID=UPI0039BD817E
MKRLRPLVFFGLALVLGVITSVLVFSWLQSEKSRLLAATLPTRTNVQVLVANADIPWGTKLTPEMVLMQEMPPDAIPEGHFTTLEAIKDRVLLVDLKRNEMLLESKLAPLGTTGGGVAAVTDVNKRAMSVKVDDVIGVAGFIKPADRVDVMVTIDPVPGKPEHAISKTILENVKVLAAGTQMERKGKDEEPKSVQVITVEVDVDEAEKLALASTQGRLRLALRNPLNSEKVLTKGAQVGSLLNSYRPKPAMNNDNGEGGYRVEIIKGDVRKEIKF